jgi:hypothetical protein
VKADECNWDDGTFDRVDADDKARNDEADGGTAAMLSATDNGLRATLVCAANEAVGASKRAEIGRQRALERDAGADEDNVDKVDEVDDDCLAAL